MASVSCVLSEDQFLCSICLEVFTDPVTTPCGHSFCCTCINKHWDSSAHCHCPVCKEKFSSRPMLKTNTFMLDMVSEFKSKPRGEELNQIQERREKVHEIQRSVELIKPAPALQDWTEQSVRAPSYKGRVAKAVSELQNTKLMPKIKELTDNVFVQAKKHPVIVTLDPDTAHPNLYLSQDYKQVKYLHQKNNLPDTPERFSTLLYVLGKQKFSSGRFYFEVQVTGKTSWFLGVTEESVNRKVDSGDMTLKNGYGYICGRNHSVPLWSAVEKVGVFVDYGHGLICFFDAETSALIHCITDCHFTENVLPLFSPGQNYLGNNSAPLILTPVPN
uniref:Uncharacterized protein n=1 Tax=Periophthalmus magnuspinnatus TaxID=409849 RepID=A0A3B4BNG3_9GOBI